MIRDELYINGTKVDLGKTNIGLIYKSNLLTDISKIVSNNSYTIKLPKTAKNLALIECTHIPSSMSRYPYLKHKGTVVRNGIEIIKDANVVLLKTGESIEIALAWGNVTNFASVVNDGKKLTDISHGTVEGVDWVVWNNKGSNSAQFPLINYGFNAGDSNVWYRPVVTVKWIFDKIQEESGVTFQFPTDKLSFIDKMIVPLFGRNPSKKIDEKFPLPINITGTYNTSVHSVYLTFSNAGDDTQINYGEAVDNNRLFKFNLDADIVISGTISLMISNSFSSSNPLNFPLYCYLYSEIGGEIVHRSILYPEIITNIGSDKTKFVYNITYNINVKSGNVLRYATASFLEDIYLADTSMIFVTFLKREKISIGEKFPLVPNLPDMKQIDFIKAIASMVGLFALPDGTNGIKFIPFDNLSANKSKAVDWTNKVIMAYNSVTPRDLKYTLDNIAQNNVFRYKEDDKVTGNYDGNIQVEDATIEYTRDAITLPFSDCDTKGEVAYIPLYSYNEKGELQYNKTNPRILLLDGVKGIFKGLEWSTLIANNYQTYKELINNAKVITEYIRLNSIELRDLEMDVPVYLSQYGCYWAIIEIKTKENDICECKLLKI